MNTNLQNVTLSIPKSEMSFFYELTRKMGWEVRPKQYVVEDAPPLYTMEEINARIDEAEAEIDGMAEKTFFAKLEKEMPWLCK